ncbi:MAG: insulinase family protein [Leptospiraceae bacterium]|nr:insulinase family protein [Leptospiraceae bacterium]MDW7975938.1 pitrilysin family protein [Leptospiraceae bacterium]
MKKKSPSQSQSLKKGKFKTKLKKEIFHFQKSTELKSFEPIHFKVNDIHIGFIPKSGSLVYLQIVNRTGSQVEKPNEWGYSHILEHMLFKGTKHYPNSIEFIHSYNKLGAHLNAYTDYDHTNYFLSILKENFHKGFPIISDMYVNPLIPANELQKEIQPILSEYREAEDDPTQYLFEESMKHFLSEYHPILGTEKNIKEVQREDLIQFKTKYYGKVNTFITIVGDIDVESFLKEVELLFKDLPTSKKPSYPKAQYRPQELLLQKKGIQEGYFLMLFPALPYKHKDRIKQNFMNYILGGMDSSLLYVRVREELGLSCYEIYSSILRNQSFSILEIFAGIDPKQIEKLKEEVQLILQSLMNEYISDDLFMIAKNTIKTQIWSSIETIKGLSGYLLQSMLQDDYRNPVETLIEEIEAITKEDVLEIAQKTFSEKPLIAKLLPKK